jgi:hypothetical protein
MTIIKKEKKKRVDAPLPAGRHNHQATRPPPPHRYMHHHQDGTKDTTTTTTRRWIRATTVGSGLAAVPRRREGGSWH